MKTCVFVCALLLGLAATAAAGETTVSQQTLSGMGLGSMQQLSAKDALAVRGKGTSAGVWGGSVARWPGGQVSSNNYSASSSWLGKPAGASGGSLSFGGWTGFSIH